MPQRGAFTLIELLIVIGIIGILAGMLFPVMGMVRESSRKTSCGSNQRQVVMEILDFVQTNQAWPGAKIGLTGAQLLPNPETNPLLKFKIMVGGNEVRLGMSLGTKQFICPSSTQQKDITVRSYAYSDAVAAGPKIAPNRIIMADRIATTADPLPQIANKQTFHKNLAVTVRADGRVGTLRGTNGVFANPDDAGINIYSYLAP